MIHRPVSVNNLILTFLLSRPTPRSSRPPANPSRRWESAPSTGRMKTKRRRRCVCFGPWPSSQYYMAGARSLFLFSLAAASTTRLEWGAFIFFSGRSQYHRVVRVFLAFLCPMAVLYGCILEGIHFWSSYGGLPRYLAGSALGLAWSLVCGGYLKRQYDLLLLRIFVCVMWFWDECEILFDCVGFVWSLVFVVDITEVEVIAWDAKWYTADIVFTRKLSLFKLSRR